MNSLLSAFTLLLSLTAPAWCHPEAPFNDQIPSAATSFTMAKISEMMYNINSIESANQQITTEGLSLSATEFINYGCCTQALIATDDTESRIVVAYRWLYKENELLNALYKWQRRFSQRSQHTTHFGPRFYQDTTVTAVPVNVRVNHMFDTTLFNGFYEDVQEKVFELLRAKQGYEVIVTGHGLSGALATLSGAMLAHNLEPNAAGIKTTVVTFGQPLVGDHRFKIWATYTFENLSIWRFVLSDDPIPRNPAASAYYPMGHLIQLESSTFTFYYDQIEKDVYSGVPKSWFNHQLDQLSNHNMEHYLLYFKTNINAYPQDPDLSTFKSWV